jgi:23S rRNA U2552 (ribose-2'-O)-methylase RlmE/FtsJ
MNDIKEKISVREKEWDFYKKYTNPYEYIHSVVPQKKKSVSKYKPISRSYFKMLEMIAEFKLDKTISRTFHLAEGPGGFIEAICNKRNNPADEYYGMTIVIDETDDNVPAWHKSGYFLSQHPNVKLEYGVDGTGNLLHIENFVHCVLKYGSSMDLITADGGFDFSKDFNRQEISITSLLWGQVCYALCLQKQGGNFILKIFDIFYEHTVHILYILSSFYGEVNVCKLKTSRIGNSEKYVVCKNFKYASYYEYYPIIYESFNRIKQNASEGRYWGMDNMMDLYALSFEDTRPTAFRKSSLVTSLCPQTPTLSLRNASLIRSGVLENSEPCIWRLLNCAIPRHFTKHVEDINAIFGQQQIENIHYTISLIDKQPKQDKLDQLVKQNVTKCVNWCIEHSIAYNNLVTANVFEAIPLAVGESMGRGGAKHPTTNWSAPEYRGLYNYC